MVVSVNVGRWFRFVAGGVLNTAVTYAIYIGLVRIAPYQLAYFLAYAIGILIAYAFNSILVFRVAVSVGRASIYPLIYLVQYAVGAGLLAVAVEYVKLPEKIAPLAVAITMIPLSYALNRLILTQRPVSQGSPDGT